jgi:cytochrome c556
MRLKIVVALAAASVAFAGVAVGQDTAIPARQNLMKENGAAMKAASAIAKGETEWREGEAAGAMKIIADNLEEFPGLFPPGSEGGGDTKASPKIWEDMAGFEAAAAKTVADAKTAEAAASQGLAAFQAALGAVGADCGACHEVYRNN